VIADGQKHKNPFTNGTLMWHKIAGKTDTYHFLFEGVYESIHVFNGSTVLYGGDIHTYVGQSSANSNTVHMRSGTSTVLTVYSIINYVYTDSYS
jgi:hypothetical protein